MYVFLLWYPLRTVHTIAGEIWLTLSKERHSETVKLFYAPMKTKTWNILAGWAKETRIFLEHDI